MDESEANIQAVVTRAQGGDQDAVAQLFQLFSDRIFRFLAIRVQPVEAAEDLTQTVFLEMIRSLPRYKVQTQTKFSTWLFQIARFRLIDHYRVAKVQVDIEAVSDQLVADPPEAPGRSLPMDEVFAALSERYATVLQLLYREELSIREVAVAMKTNPLNVRVLKHRALRALRRELEQRNITYEI